uniref:Uncharacterized protein n=1 Tax=Rhizophora mucronata TaxID=61149 RepID=A0A2P2PXV5_RHIMU
MATYHVKNEYCCYLLCAQAKGSVSGSQLHLSSTRWTDRRQRPQRYDPIYLTLSLKHSNGEK